MVSDLLRQALTATPVLPDTSVVRESPSVYGFRPFPKSGALVTNELIDELRSDDAY